MTKPTFTTALRRARAAQQAFPLKDEDARMYIDELYRRLSKESDQDVLDALERIGSTNDKINFANIQALIDAHKPIVTPPRAEQALENRSMEEVYRGFPPQLKEIFDNLINHKKMEDK